MKKQTKLLGLAALPLVAGVMMAGNAFADTTTLESRALAAGFADVNLYSCVEDYAIENSFTEDDGVALTDVELAAIAEVGTDYLSCPAELFGSFDDPTQVIHSITGIEKLTGIKKLGIGGEITDFSPLKSLTGLEELEIDYEKDVAQLDLTGLPLKSLQITNASALASFIAGVLDGGGDPVVAPKTISSLVLGDMTTLKSFYAVFTDIKGFKLDGLDLEELAILDASLEQLDISDQKNLTSVMMAVPAFKQKLFDLTGLEHLEDVELYSPSEAEVELVVRDVPFLVNGEKYIYDLSGLQFIDTIEDTEEYTFDEDTRLLTVFHGSDEGVVIYINGENGEDFLEYGGIMLKATPLHINAPDVPDVPDTGLFTAIETFIRESYVRYIAIALGFLGAGVLAVKMVRSHSLRKLWK